MVTGTTLVNGRPDRLERYKSLMGFVPQVGVVVGRHQVRGEASGCVVGIHMLPPGSCPA